MNIERFFLKKQKFEKTQLPTFNGKLNKKRKVDQFDRHEFNCLLIST